ncbi:Membrane-bound lytic murein transglycosylase C [Pleomorphomonas sp. T1.2MG-36]|uniref:lytic transglycosylase domain-containing protein n=1 Tax=Pleomorphomonas sp. T1.2MG-36 TaxID=3041167 RepID=UPI002477A972|nr:lytic transglycosylase domain-containing protein [Pleomorphomonas sp. T1.2MG-36]CAI9404968.1 Membrane-bound lytic murein transglycosylase C [Pleomorphomonas sp. T1.2MG-36]
MRSVSLRASAISLRSVIPLFAGKPSHPFAPLDDRSAGARSGGQGRSKIGALRVPLTAASTLAGWCRSGEGAPVRMAVILLSGMLYDVAIPAMALAQPLPVVQPSSRDPYGDHIAEAAQRFELPSAWIRAVMHVESDGDPRALSPKGAIGLMQIMPETWAALRVRYRLSDDPYDPHDNIVAGAAYIRELFDRYGSPEWIAAYNAGPGRYEEALKGRPLPPETRAYVAALAPIISNGETTGAVMIASADPLSWTRAPLFIGQPLSKATVPPVQSDKHKADAPQAVTVRDLSAIVPQSGGLFVARADAGRQP